MNAPAREGILAEVRGLRVFFKTDSDPIRAVDGAGLVVRAGETAALVGESGCGKSVLSLALARLVPHPGMYVGGEILFRGEDVLKMSRERISRLRGGQIAYVFQEPGSALNPVFRVGAQILEAVRLHEDGSAGGGGSRRDRRVIEMLEMVGLPDPVRRAKAYPHELSGGMQQRVMMAMALACSPDLLVADEPTTALDVTIQAQILELLVSLQRKMGMAVLLITHNLGLVADIAHVVSVMYAGRIVESGPTELLLSAPAHPYTRGLLDAVPRLTKTGPLSGIAGSVPNPARLPTGCKFAPRCPYAQDVCSREEPPLSRRGDGGEVRCFFPIVECAGTKTAGRGDDAAA